MKTFEERMEILDKALKNETKESLFKKLNKFKPCGPNIIEFGKSLQKLTNKLK